MTSTVLAYIPSPSQGVWHLGPFPLRAYALFIIVGIVAALVLGDRRWTARGGEPGVIYDVALWAVPFGLVGGRLYHVLTDWPTYFGENGVGLGAALRIWDGGLGIWGAVALGGVGAWIACRRRGIPLPAFGDAIAPGIVLAQAIGRLGNYFNQELFGRETTLPWGLEIYERVNAAGVRDSLNGVSTGELVQVVHPTFLYELLWNLLVFAMLILVDRRFKIGHGRLFALYVAGYCVGRFWIELMRSDTATLLAGIRVNTFTSTFVFVAAVVYIMVAPKGREAPETLKGNQDSEHDVEELAKDVAIASATGVVAAATVAGQDEAADKAEETGGIGAVEGDEAVEAAEGAAAAHDAAVESAADAATLAALLEVADDDAVDGDDAAVAEGDTDVPPVPAEAGGLGAVEGDEAVEAAEGAPAALDVVSGDADDTEGLGAVEGDEVAEAVEDAPAAHEVAVEGEELAQQVSEAEPVGGAEGTDESESEPTTDDDAEVDGEDVGDSEAEGVEVAEAAEAAEDASVAHEVAAEGEIEAEELAAQIADAEPVGGAETEESETEPTADDDAEGEAAAEELADVAEADESSVPVGEAEAEGLGAVEGDEVAEAVEDAPVAHGAAVEGETAAEEFSTQVVDAEPVVGADAEDSDSEPDANAEADDVSDDDAEGLGAVEGDEVAGAVADAPVAHEVAVEGEAAAEELAADVEAEEEGDESESESGVVAGVGEGAGEGEGSESEGEAVAEPEPAEQSDAKPSPYSVVTESSDAQTQSGPASRVRKWLRNRRGR